MIEAFQLTVVAMVVVFLALVGIMFMMELTHILISRTVKVNKAPVQTTSASSSTASVGQTVDFGKDELARVAALTALSQASEDHSDRHFVIDSIIKK